jgi:hypothetical protein
MPIISKKRLDSLKKRGRGGVRRVGGGIKSNALQVLAGAAAQLIEAQVVKNFPTVANQGWWAPPAAMAALGLLAKRSKRFQSTGDAMLGAAGYSFGIRYAGMKASTSGEAGRLVGVPFRPRLVAAATQAPVIDVAETTTGVRGLR